MSKKVNLDLIKDKLSLDKAERVREAAAVKIFDSEKIAQAIFDAANLGLEGTRIEQKIDGMFVPFTLDETKAADVLITWLHNRKYKLRWTQRAIAADEEGNPANYGLAYKELYIYWSEVIPFIDVNDQNREEEIE